MIICLGPICLPVWHLWVVLVFLFKPIKNVAISVLEATGARKRAAAVIEDARRSRAAAPKGPIEAAGDEVGAADRDAAAPPPPESTGSFTLVNSDAEWDAAVEAARALRQPFVVQFSAAWCQPCVRFLPTFKALAAEFPAALAKVDVDVCPKLAEGWGVAALPTFIGFRCGPEGLERVGGVQGAQKLEVESLLARCCVAQS
eukprot:Polyplicarium_translucidae@DN1769_c0_g1_i2.p1